MTTVLERLGPPIERARLRLAASLAVHPRRAVGLILFVVTLAVLMSPAPPAVADDGCGGGVTGILCSGAHKIGIGGLWDEADATVETINSLSPNNFLDTWAQGLCSAVVFVLAFIEATAEKLGTPAYNQQWWATQYAVSFGLSMIALAFLLLIVTAKIGASGGSVSSVELLRTAGVRLIFVFPACAAAPAVLYSVQQAAAELTKAFAVQSEKDAHGAVGGLMTFLKKHAGDWGNFGGTILVIVMMAAVLLTAVVLLIEVAVANWGLTLVGLLVPFGIVAAVYPPWATVLRRLSTVILTLMFTPVFIFFFFWTIWSSFNSLINSNDSSNSGFSIVLYLLISLIMIDAFPLVAIWLLGLATPDFETMDPSVKDLAPTPTGGEVYDKTFERKFRRTEGDGSDAGGGGGDTNIVVEDDDDEPEVGDAPKDTGGDGHGPTGGGPSEGPGGASSGAAEGSAGGAEAGAGAGAAGGAEAGAEGGPAGIAAGAVVGAVAAKASEDHDSGPRRPRIPAPDGVRARAHDLIDDADGGGR